MTILRDIIVILRLFVHGATGRHELLALIGYQADRRHRSSLNERRGERMSGSMEPKQQCRHGSNDQSKRVHCVMTGVSATKRGLVYRVEIR